MGISVYPEDKQRGRKGCRGLDLSLGPQIIWWQLERLLLPVLGDYEVRDQSLDSGSQLPPLYSGWPFLCFFPPVSWSSASLPWQMVLKQEIIFWPLVQELTYALANLVLCSSCEAICRNELRLLICINHTFSPRQISFYHFYTQFVFVKHIFTVPPKRK